MTSVLNGPHILCVKKQNSDILYFMTHDWYLISTQGKSIRMVIKKMTDIQDKDVDVKVYVGNVQCVCCQSQFAPMICRLNLHYMLM